MGVIIGTFISIGGRAAFSYLKEEVAAAKAAQAESNQEHKHDMHQLTNTIGSYIEKQNEETALLREIVGGVTVRLGQAERDIIDLKQKKS